MNITKEQIEFAKQSNDIVSLIKSRGIRLKKKRQELYWPVSLPYREDPILYGRSGKTAIPLFWLFQ